MYKMITGVLIALVIFGIYQFIVFQQGQYALLNKFRNDCENIGGYVAQPIPNSFFSDTYQCIKNGSGVKE